MILAPLVAPLWKDVPTGIRRYSGLKVTPHFGYSQNFPAQFGEDTLRNLSAQVENRTLLDTLMFCLRTFRSDTEIRFQSLEIEQSDYEPAASLYLGQPSTVIKITFAETEGPREGVQQEPIVHRERMRGYVLTAMADLLAENFAAAKHTRPRCLHENGSSVSPDEPLPSDELPRAGKPATTRTHQKARRERDKSQAGLQSYGNSSGGSPLPHRGSTDEKRP
jgi:hypothetical protein